MNRVAKFLKLAWQKPCKKMNYIVKYWWKIDHIWGEKSANRSGDERISKEKGVYKGF